MSMTSYEVGVRITTTDSDGKSFTSAPTYIEASDPMNMQQFACTICSKLSELESYGVIDEYSVVLKCNRTEGDQ